MDTAIYGKEMKKQGIVPAIGMCNPKYAHNVGAAVRAASCFGAKQVWFSGNRVSLDPEKGERLPREERMKGYKDVELRQFDYFFDQFDRDVVPVAIELRPGSELLPQFVHSDKALYVFGPEDGSINQVMLRHCHRFVVIPTHHCVNLAAAIYMVLYDRMVKRQQLGLDPILPMEDILKENRGWGLPDNNGNTHDLLQKLT
jgi:tRNA(Leu) C34 or U34 (ribose-2'-O)-methylase TrmL